MKDLIRFLRKIVCSVSPVYANKIMYRVLMKKDINLKEPQTFNEKINWLKLYEYPNNPLVIKCTDKYAVREYIESKGLSRILNDIYGVYENIKEINWGDLPNEFVLKCNHGCGYNIICDDKKNLNIKESNKKLNNWMNENFGLVSCEPHYSKIKKKIICEKYLGKDILDYKFFCFKGEPKFLYISRAVKGSHHGLKADFLNMDGTKMPFRRPDHDSFEVFPNMISNLEEAKIICRTLSEDFEFVRVDLFEVDEKIYFSELTFSPCSGMMPIEPQEYDKELGKMIDLKEK